MTKSDDLRLAELLCARLCHDLAGPLGGAATGLELLEGEEEAAADAELLRLVAAGIGTAVRHLKVLRAACGAGRGAAPVAELRLLAEGFLASPPGASHRIVLEWAGAAGRALEAPEARLLLNMVLAGRDLLPRGGRLLVNIEPPPGLATVTAEGQGLAEAEIAAGLAAPAAENLSPRAAQAHYAARLGDSLGYALALDIDGSRALLAARRY